MSNRELILNRLKKASPADNQSRAQVKPAEIKIGDIDVFLQKANAAGAQAVRVANMDAAQQHLQRILQEAAPQAIIGSNEPIIKELNLAAWADDTGVVYRAAGDLTDMEYRAYVLRADIGITGCDYALANSGTLVISHKHTNERLISLAPIHYICLVKAEQLLADRFSMAAALERDGLLSNPVITMITGVSRTADVALQVVLGMHGPRKMDIIFIG